MYPRTEFHSSDRGREGMGGGGGGGGVYSLSERKGMRERCGRKELENRFFLCVGEEDKCISKKGREASI